MRQGIELWIAADLMNEFGRLCPPVGAIAAKVRQDFAEHFIRRDETNRPKRAAKRQNIRVMRVAGKVKVIQ